MLMKCTDEINYINVYTRENQLGSCHNSTVDWNHLLAMDW